MPEVLDTDRHADRPEEDAGVVAMTRPGTAHAPASAASALVRLLVLAVTGAVLLAALSGSWLWLSAPSDHVLVSAGPVADVRPALATSATDPAFAGRDAGWLVTTVTAASLSNAGMLRARVSRDPRLTAVEAGAPDARVAAQLAMEHTKRLAPALAEQLRTGAPLPQATSVQVVGVAPGEAAELAGLQVGDVVTSVDGRAATLETFTGALDDAVPVDLEVSYNGIGEPRQLTLPTSDRYGLRVMPRLATPGVQQFDLTGITGGSGGLIMTLAALDAASPGDLAALGTVAGTGAIDASGEVIAVEGVRHKAQAAADAGAAVFFHPASAPPPPAPAGIEVVAVATVADALAWLCDNGADDAVCR